MDVSLTVTSAVPLVASVSTPLVVQYAPAVDVTNGGCTKLLAPAEPAEPAEPVLPALPPTPRAPALAELPLWPAPAALGAPPEDGAPALFCRPPLPAATDIPALPLVVGGEPALPTGTPPVPADGPPLPPEGVLLEHATSNTAIVQVIGWIRMSFSIQSRDCSSRT